MYRGPRASHMAEVKRNNQEHHAYRGQLLKWHRRKEVELMSGNHDELGTIFFLIITDIQ